MKPGDFKGERGGNFHYLSVEVFLESSKKGVLVSHLTDLFLSEIGTSLEMT